MNAHRAGLGIANFLLRGVYQHEAYDSSDFLEMAGVDYECINLSSRRSSESFLGPTVPVRVYNTYNTQITDLNLSLQEFRKRQNILCIEYQRLDKRIKSLGSQSDWAIATLHKQVEDDCNKLAILRQFLPFAISGHSAISRAEGDCLARYIDHIAVKRTNNCLVAFLYRACNYLNNTNNT